MTEFTRSTGNVFEDLGFDADESALLSTKSQLLGALARRAAEYATQAEAAAALGLHQPDVSAIVNGKINLFTADRLLKLCEKAGLRVEVSIENLMPA